MGFQLFRGAKTKKEKVVSGSDCISFAKLPNKLRRLLNTPLDWNGSVSGTTFFLTSFLVVSSKMYKYFCVTSPYIKRHTAIVVVVVVDINSPNVETPRCRVEY